jgi:hypothetical protein
MAIFVHFYEMFVGMGPLIPLFWLFHALRWPRKGMNPIDT